MRKVLCSVSVYDCQFLSVSGRLQCVSGLRIVLVTQPNLNGLCHVCCESSWSYVVRVTLLLKSCSKGGVLYSLVCSAVPFVVMWCVGGWMGACGVMWCHSGLRTMISCGADWVLLTRRFVPSSVSRVSQTPSSLSARLPALAATFISRFIILRFHSLLSAFFSFQISD